jgi:hypothetical protein
MTGTRRIATVLALTVGVILGAGVSASAGFADTVSVSPAISTGTVAAPAWLTVDDSCTTTTTVVKRTVYTNPGTGAQTVTAYSSTTTYGTSTSNVQGTTSSSVAGPGPNEVTTTTTTKNTAISVSASWGASGSRGVTGYLVNAHLNNGQVFPMTQTGANVLWTSDSVDADSLVYAPRLSVTTLTSYGWTASTAQTRVLGC